MSVAVREWQGWGVLLGARLPNRDVDFSDSCRVIRPPSQRLDSLLRDVPRLNHPQGLEKPFMTVVPSHTRIVSGHVAWFRVHSSSIDAAVEEITNELMPSLLGALTTVADEPTRCQLLRVGAASADGWISEPVSPWTRSGRFTQMRTTDLFGAALREAVTLAGTIANSPADCQLAARYQEAVSQTDRISGDEPLEQARSLHAFYQVVEDVVGRTSQKPGRVPRHDVSAIATQLLTDLQSTNHDEYWQAKRIRAAGFQIAALERRPFRLQAEDAVRRLGLGAETLEAVLELQQRRNTQTGHPDTWPTADLVALVPLAERCARRLMGAYFRSKVEK